MLKFLSGVVSEGSADAFATASMATGLSNLSLGYRVRGIMYEMPDLVEVDNEITINICRRQPTALVSIGDRTLIHAHKRQVILTTSGQAIYNGYPLYLFPKDLDLLIVEDPLFLSVDSTGTSQSVSVRARIYYEEVRLSETAKLAALTESLNA